MNKFVLTVIVDHNYIEPALVTIFDLARSAPDYFDVTLIYIESNSKDVNLEVFGLIDRMLISANIGKRINAILLKAKLFDKFEKYHFTNSIIYKLVLPEILNYEYIINIDAGFLTGSDIGKFFEYIRVSAESPDFLNSPIGAVCSLAEKELPAELIKHQHSSQYPIGWILFFNREAYKRSNYFDKLLSGYQKFKEALVWAEQDLLCLVAKEGEIFDLKIKDFILIEQLSIGGLAGIESSKAYHSNFMLYKITGTLKPWKYWVLDPRKKFYLQRREAILPGLILNDCKLIMHNRFDVNHVPLQRAFLQVHEQLLLSAP